jgi:hypothetical protein
MLKIIDLNRNEELSASQMHKVSGGMFGFDWYVQNGPPAGSPAAGGSTTVGPSGIAGESQDDVHKDWIF